MSVIYKFTSKTRLIIGIVALVLGLLFVFIEDLIIDGFPKGFIGGVLVGLGIGLIITHRKEK